MTTGVRASGKTLAAPIPSHHTAPFTTVTPPPEAADSTAATAAAPDRKVAPAAASARVIGPRRALRATNTPPAARPATRTSASQEKRANSGSPCLTKTLTVEGSNSTSSAPSGLNPMTHAPTATVASDTSASRPSTEK
ncbi:hypothetical protein [Phytomonospora endophytica]|uniref:Uncharacterized protein n=1 Tax=Phytomonospora endophytica TaxID=714109 RepID=A0A841FJJ0_9ACTN|nr:hypothetical protein [Phytomonospora endophytica]MBB6035113.1 hypothetical protein [Phytomonospora endophytica]GIG64139.1 hypothetical protein Pen01_04340 [Phytomonospora endophytica]